MHSFATSTCANMLKNRVMGSYLFCQFLSSPDRSVNMESGLMAKSFQPAPASAPSGSELERPIYLCILTTVVEQGGSFFMGQLGRILRETRGMPHREWIKIPNDGLIRYNAFLNAERVLLASPAAIAEVVVTKSYEFVKPRELREVAGRLLGIGLLLAEGNEHKVLCVVLICNKRLITDRIEAKKGSYPSIFISPH